MPKKVKANKASTLISSMDKSRLLNKLNFFEDCAHNYEKLVKVIYYVLLLQFPKTCF